MRELSGLSSVWHIQYVLALCASPIRCTSTRRDDWGENVDDFVERRYSTAYRFLNDYVTTVTHKTDRAKAETLMRGTANLSPTTRSAL
jgi:hypothetical protein